jgi:hypothetical protein
MLLSAGDFAVYESETHVFDMLMPRFNGLRRRADREEMLRYWLSSEYFRRSGLRPEELRDRILDECRNGGDFLRMLMGTIATKQGARRWANTTPTYLGHVEEIKRAIPDALFIHMIRDGRDVALSMAEQGWIRPLPWNRGGRLLAAGLAWEWLIDCGRPSLQGLPSDAIEVHYEDLIQSPQDTLDRVGDFIQHDLNYERILAKGIGSVIKPNTSFDRDRGFNPIGRWKKCKPEELSILESGIGRQLERLGYPRAAPKELRQKHAWVPIERAVYRTKFTIRIWLKLRTPLGRKFTNIALLEDFQSGDRDRLQTNGVK